MMRFISILACISIGGGFGAETSKFSEDFHPQKPFYHEHHSEDNTVAHTEFLR